MCSKTTNIRIVYFLENLFYRIHYSTQVHSAEIGYVLISVQGRHDKLAQNEFLSHTLKNKVISFIFFCIKNSPEGCRWSGSPTGSQQHFLLPKGLNVRESGHHGGLQGVKSVMVGTVEG